MPRIFEFFLSIFEPLLINTLKRGLITDATDMKVPGFLVDTLEKQFPEDLNHEFVPSVEILNPACDQKLS